MSDRRVGQAAGSSPRGRGKQTEVMPRLQAFRLIPARAGKTSFFPGVGQAREAHPRAGGENLPSSR